MTSKAEMVEFIAKECGYSERFLNTLSEVDLEGKIHGMSIIAQYGSEDMQKLLFRGRYPV